MYEAFYGLNARPFSKTPDPAFLFEGKKHGEALARLEMAAVDRDIALLTGDIGAGKTTLSRALVDRLDDRYRVVLVINPRLSGAQLIEYVAQRLGVDPLPKHKAKLIDALAARLFALHEEGAIPLLIIDEAHLLPSAGVFEELRLLTNLQLDDTPLIGLLLVGQPELRDKLAKPNLASFAQRVGVAYHLSALDEQETAAYVEHRLSHAGRHAPLFTDEALSVVYRASGGVPRRINTVCQSALLVGFGAGAARIDKSHVEDVWSDLSEHLGAVFDNGGRAGGRTRAGGRAKRQAGAA
jgi:general secretion pathway protein A